MKSIIQSTRQPSSKQLRARFDRDHISDPCALAPEMSTVHLVTSPLPSPPLRPRLLDKNTQSRTPVTDDDSKSGSSVYASFPTYPSIPTPPALLSTVLPEAFPTLFSSPTQNQPSLHETPQEQDQQPLDAINRKQTSSPVLARIREVSTSLYKRLSPASARSKPPPPFLLPLSTSTQPSTPTTSPALCRRPRIQFSGTSRQSFLWRRFPGRSVIDTEAISISAPASPFPSTARSRTFFSSSPLSPTSSSSSSFFSSSIPSLRHKNNHVNHSNDNDNDNGDLPTNPPPSPAIGIGLGLHLRGGEGDGGGDNRPVSHLLWFLSGGIGKPPTVGQLKQAKKREQERRRLKKEREEEEKRNKKAEKKQGR